MAVTTQVRLLVWSFVAILGTPPHIISLHDHNYTFAQLRRDCYEIVFCNSCLQIIPTPRRPPPDAHHSAALVAQLHLLMCACGGGSMGKGVRPKRN